MAVMNFILLPSIALLSAHLSLAVGPSNQCDAKAGCQEAPRPQSSNRALVQVNASTLESTPAAWRGSLNTFVVRGGQPTNPEVVAKAEKVLRERGALAAKGALHFTKHGCHCLLSWSFAGRSYRACDGPEDAEFAGGFPWCEVSDDCAKPDGVLPSGKLWDHCTSPEHVSHALTVHGCHCMPEWDYNGTTNKGCVTTASGVSWCNVFEGSALCPEALKTEHFGSHWDFCFRMDQTSPFLTKNGCHCLPEWTVSGVTHNGCAPVLVEGENATGCVVLEDATACPGAKVMVNSTRRFDECTVPTGREVFVLPELYDAGTGCHCMPEWTYKGEVYQGCTNTSDAPDGPFAWCFVIEDERLCKDVDGFVAVDNIRWRWKYCEATATEVAPPSNGSKGIRVTPLVIPVDDMIDHGAKSGQIDGKAMHASDGDEAMEGDHEDHGKAGEADHEDQTEHGTEAGEDGANRSLAYRHHVAPALVAMIAMLGFQLLL